jgi:GT2 family glycosyltransferase
MTTATVIIPTYNRSEQLRRVLEALERQDVPGAFDVIVVDDGSQDATRDVLRLEWSFALTALHQPNGGPAAARNLAIQRAPSNLVVFVDDDVVPATDLVRQHLETQARQEGVVIGRLLPPPGRQPAWAAWECRTLEHQYRLMQRGRFQPTPRQFYTANASVPRAALLKAGMFDPRYRRAEDVELAYRLGDLGLPFIFQPDAIVEHDTPRTFEAWRSIAGQYGQYDVMMWRHGRRHILGNISGEFKYFRNPLTRVIARAAVGRPALMSPLTIGGGLAVRALSAVGPRRAAFSLCGAYFNALYLDGACAELGVGRRGFWRTLHDELQTSERTASAAVGT